MKDVAVDLNPAVPSIKPFFFGYWANQAMSAGAWVNLPITTAVNSQGGMVLSGGGCKVPIPGIYHLGAYCRSDCSGTGAIYAALAIVVNGTSQVQSLTNNGYVSGTEWQYAYHQLWYPMPLNAGDVVTCQGYQSALPGTFYGAASWAGAGLRVLYDSPWTGEP